MLKCKNKHFTSVDKQEFQMSTTGCKQGLEYCTNANSVQVSMNQITSSLITIAFFLVFIDTFHVM